MKSFASMFGVATCGLITSVLTALGITVIQNLIGFQLFTFSVWIVIPVGAIATGMAAASGYYFGSLYFHYRPNIFLLLQMVVIAGITQVLIYYLEYSTLVLDNGIKASALVSFSQYLDISLTQAHYRIGRGAHDAGAVGEFGYWLAVFQFLGFLAGGVLIYFILKSYPVCPNCNRYFRVLSTRKKQFYKGEDFALYYENIFKLSVDSQEFARAIQAEYKVPRLERGTIQLETKLNGCPSCKTQMIEDKVSVWNGNDWKDTNKLSRRILLPENADLIRVFRPAA